MCFRNRLVLLPALLLALFTSASLHAQDGVLLPQPTLSLELEPAIVLDDGLLCVPGEVAEFEIGDLPPGITCSLWVKLLDAPITADGVVRLAQGFSSVDGHFRHVLKIPDAARGRKYEVVALALTDDGELLASKRIGIALD